MKVLFFTNINISSQTGVTKKILCQTQSFWNVLSSTDNIYLGAFYDNELYQIYEQKNTLNSIIELPLIKTKYERQKLSQIYSEVLNFIVLEKIDLIYIRYYQIDRKFINFINKIKNNKVKIFIEVPTFPFYSERYKSISKNFLNRNIPALIKNIFLFIKEVIADKALHNNIDKIITFSEDAKIFNIDTIKIDNGIDTLQIRKRNYHKLNEKLNLLFVANISYWHGIDRLLKGMFIYKKQNGDMPIFLHIVGNGEYYKKCRQETYDLGLNDDVMFYGKKSGEELEQLYSIADIAISTLGIHRKKIKIDSSLKTREYFAKGIPCIGTSRDKQIMELPLKKYYYAFNSDETPINLNEVINFYKKCREEENFEQHIRDLAGQYLNWDIQTSKIIGEYKNIIC